MTIQQLKEMIDDFTIIKCRNARERNNVLRFLEKIGYTLGSCSANHVRNHDDDDDDSPFIHPGLDRSQGRISSWKHPVIKGYNSTEYDDVADLVENGIESEEDNGEEFMTAFSRVLFR